VFWYADNGPLPNETPGQRRLRQCLACWHVSAEGTPQYPYSVLKGIDIDRLTRLFPLVPADDIPELLEYVREFCSDVETDERYVE
jgi:hypothetical protein